jgi:hypothetical protein
MEYILIIITSLSVRTATPSVATAEFADLQACNTARVTLVNKFEATRIGTGATIETACVPKRSAPKT